MARAARPWFLTLALLAGCQSLATPAAPTTVPASTLPVTAASSRTVPAPACTRSGYSRAQFGNQPSSTVRKALVAAQTNSDGTITDPYDGATWSSATGLEADHRVPLAYAWDHGACSWSMTDRITFAKDLTNLVLVRASYNESKADQGPSTWLPPIGRCTYVATFLATLTRYHLSALPADQAKAAAVCP